MENHNGKADMNSLFLHFAELHSALCNLVKQWYLQNTEFSNLMGTLCNNKKRLIEINEIERRENAREPQVDRQMEPSPSENQRMFTSDEILHKSECISASLSKMRIILDRLCKYLPKLSAYGQLLTATENLSANQILLLRVYELSSQLSQLISIIQRNFTFLQSLFNDLAFIEDKDTIAIVIIALKHGLYSFTDFLPVDK